MSDSLLCTYETWKVGSKDAKNVRFPNRPEKLPGLSYGLFNYPMDVFAYQELFRAHPTEPGTQPDLGQKNFNFLIFCRKVDSLEESSLPQLVTNEFRIKLFVWNSSHFLRGGWGIRDPDSSALGGRGLLIRVRFCENDHYHLFCS